MISAYLTRPIPPPFRDKPANDPQRSRLYILEREFMGSILYGAASKVDLQVVLRHVCRYYKIKAPKFFIYNDPEEHSCGYSELTLNEDGSYSHFKIGLNRGFYGANVFTLLHELAHYIADSTWAEHRGHGPKFVGIYMHLLDKYHVVPGDAFRTVAKRRRVKIAGKFKPDAIRG